MTRKEVIEFMHKRYGKKWIKPFAEESGYSNTSVWRFANGITPLTRRMELEVERLKNNGQKRSNANG
jgi:hypothetical protein